MSIFGNFWSNLFGNPIAERWGEDYFILDPKADFSEFTSDLLKIQTVFSNPAVLRIFKLQCDLFSLGKVYVYRNGKEVPNDPFIDRINNPNPFQTREQFLWDFMFWKMLGNNYCYVDSDSVSAESNKMYHLDPAKIQWPDYFSKMRDKLILSNQAVNQIKDTSIEYRYSDGTGTQIKWSRITHTSDLTNGSGNWFKGRSAIDALYEIIANSRAGIRSKNINVRYAGKYMVAGKADPENVTQMPLGNDEKRDIETKMNGRKSVHAVKSMIDIKRFIENANILKELDESYKNDFFMIGSMYGIPKDVLEVYANGSTYENQEKARGAHVSYCLSPSGNQFMSMLAKRFGYTTREIIIDWEHLPFMQVFAKERSEIEYKKTQSLLNLMKAGVKIDEINATLDTNFTELDYDRAERSSQSGTNRQDPTGN